MTSKELMEQIVRYADERKAIEQTVIGVERHTTLTDYFIVMTGSSNTHIKALADFIEEKLKKDHEIYPHHIEGVTSNWILLDYTGVVVNIFTEDTREMFALERLWADGVKIDLSHLVTPN